MSGHLFQHKKIVALASLFVVSRAFDIPRDDCIWRSGNYGWFNSCEGNEVAIGGCGSGSNANCDGFTDQVC